MPNGPIEFSRITADKCTISWEPPLDDGSADITHYIIDKRETSRLRYDTVYQYPSSQYK